MTRLHPTAKISLKMLGVKSANELARICAGVGLVQNLGALRALTTLGIIEGHMKLHIQNLTLGAGQRAGKFRLFKNIWKLFLALKTVFPYLRRWRLLRL